MKKHEIITALDTYIDARDELVEMATNSEWRKWLVSPDAWLQYMLANFTTDQQKAITSFVLSDDSRRWMSIYDTIFYVYEHPEYIKTIRSLKDMLEQHGAMVE